MNDYVFKEIREGMEASFEKIVTDEMIDDFSSMSGDVNPLHLDSEEAKRRGYDDKVVYGMLIGSFYSTLVGVYLPGKNALLHGIDISFIKPVYSGQKLIISGKVTYLNEAYKQIEIKAVVCNEDREKVSRAKIKVGVHE